MAKRRSDIGKKGKHGREGFEIDLAETTKRSKKTLLIMVTIIVVIVLILASLYYFFIYSEEPEEEKEVLTTDSLHEGGYPNETVVFMFTIYNPKDEDDVFGPMVSGLPSDWEVDMPSTIPLEGKKSKEEQFSIRPSLATGLNRTYHFILNVTSANTQRTYTLEFEITVFELLIDVEITSDAHHKAVYPNGNISYNFTIYNPNDFVDVFWPSIFGLPSDWEITIPNNVSVGGNTTNEDQFFLVPSSETALNETYSFWLSVTSGHTQRPYFYQYNLTVSQTYGFELLCYNNSHDADPGRSTYYAITVNNTGNGEETFTISYNESHLPNNWSISFDFDSLNISGLSSAVVICNITTFSNTSKGRYDIDIIVTSSSGGSASIMVNTSLIKDFEEETLEIGDKAQVNYTGTLTDGVIFDTSHFDVANNSDYPKFEDFSIRPSYSPLKMFVNGTDSDESDDYGVLIEGFWEGVIGMKVNETKVIRIPPEKAYTKPGWESHVLYGKTLIFEATLVSIDN
jgi:flagellar basal body-associated protein FliL